MQLRGPLEASPVLVRTVLPVKTIYVKHGGMILEKRKELTGGIDCILLGEVS